MKQSMNIAIVEDHKALREIFVAHLIGDGFKVFGASSAEELDEYFANERADLLILDVNLPGEDGLSIARRYRNAYPKIHIIMLTVKAEAKDKILGYESGADIYLPKPISAEELSAAVNSIKRRVLVSKENSDLPNLDVAKKLIAKDATRVGLGGVEVVLLKGLIEAVDHVMEYWQLLELLDLEVTDKNKSNLGVYIHRLNKKLIEIGLPEPAIKALWRHGYQLTEDIYMS